MDLCKRIPHKVAQMEPSKKEREGREEPLWEQLRHQKPNGGDDSGESECQMLVLQAPTARQPRKRLQWVGMPHTNSKGHDEARAARNRDEKILLVMCPVDMDELGEEEECAGARDSEYNVRRNSLGSPQ